MELSPPPTRSEDLAEDGSSPLEFRPRRSSRHKRRPSYPPSNTPPHHMRGRTATATFSAQHPMDAAIANDYREYEGRKDGNSARSCHVKRRKLANEQAQLSAKEAKMVVVRGNDGFAYRRSIQVFFVNEKAQFLLCQPAGKCNVNFRQTVQGGSEGEESPQETARREVWEEIGLVLGRDATFVCEVRPLDAASGEEDAVRNENGEILSEFRRSFRYRSKTWRKLGIRGQELYPLLYMLEQKRIRHLDTCGWRRGVPSEFHSVEWGSLADLADKAPSTKKAVMESVCRAVAAAAKPFLESRGYPSAALANLISDEPATA
ncbi:hypothetical protein CUR178_02276 [Leishmania enriettii]|uniref:Nudix hydrolase domain-containing protein n=1 Tax=Leishmania enriettii TaxID=5663 RepID=A0A836GCL7_LEIEN|nr:hypothetical protein CUR178_02276 [Leishmania enriettii]